MTINDSHPENTQKIIFHSQTRKDMFWQVPACTLRFENLEL